MNLFKKELKYNLKSFFIWGSVLIMFSLLFVPFIDGILQDSDSLKKFMDSMPKFLLKSFGTNTDTFFTPEGFFSTKGMTMAYILTGIFSVLIASNMFAYEYQKKTIEYLLIKPYSRLKIFLIKSFSLIFFYLVYFFIFGIANFLLFKSFVHYEYNINIINGFALYLFVIEMFFGSIAVLLSVLFQKTILTQSISIGLFVFMYFSDMLGFAIDSMSWIRNFTIFKYFSLNETVSKGHVFVLNSFIIILISLTIMYVSMIIFKNKEIEY
ncbi:hypothetical protein OSSY52_02900 [Tepiditoga spiralis]|uniref:ABC transporter permease n=1 Tax=Tepiditoga spiralis TaxID=2108365 RepID=A0A7G1G9X6_9BACT|nr:ABC transporter permease subunit [Tepiditoga spiralis]BBE30149.1 hypothetical protein OSSY52_02900 [Tepiditoga spiralis]